jgi:putative transposase
VTASEHRGRFVFTVTMEAADFHPKMRHRASDSQTKSFVGIDPGLSAYLVAARSDGEEVERVAGSRPLERSLPKLRRASKRASRKVRGSKNRRKANEKLNRIHARVADQRRDFTHRVSTRLVKTHDALCTENLSVANLARNRRLARHIYDASWSALASQLTYKADWYGTELVKAPRFFPSTKTCSDCGWIWEDMGLDDRVFVCQRCPLVKDRDTNAATNLAAWAEAELRSAAQAPDPEALGRVRNACGGTGAGLHQDGGGTGSETPSEDGKRQEPALAAHSAA